MLEITKSLGLGHVFELEMVGDNPPWISVIYWRIPARGCGWPFFCPNLADIWVSPGIPDTNGWLEGFPSSRQGCAYLEGGYPRIPASGCRFPWKKQPDIQMQSNHLYILQTLQSLLRPCRPESLTRI
jgi:hypothetical protein